MASAKNLSLFGEQELPEKRSYAEPSAHAPLAEKLRPMQWEDFAGLAKLEPKLIAKLRSGEGKPPSLVLWGPPGCGKTTLAKLIGRTFHCRFVELSAVLAGVKDVRDVVAEAKLHSKPTLLFLDEIHRFNKAQQDAFLPHVESGVITLIGATTENPSFYLGSALLSRMRVVAMPAHSDTALREILSRALVAVALRLAKEGEDLLVQVAAGDARRLINLIEACGEAWRGRGDQVGKEELQSYLKSAQLLFHDRSGEEHYNVVSAFIKSMRGSNVDGALYWGFRMLEAGEDPRFLIRRMIIFSSEDIGNADPHALTLAVATLHAYEHVGLPEGRIPIAQCITYLAQAPKSNKSYAAMNKVLEVIAHHPKVTVPMHLRNAPTGLMKELGYGDGYQYPHDYPEGKVAGVEYLPEELRGVRFFEEEGERGRK